MNHAQCDIFVDLVLIDHEILDIIHKKELNRAEISGLASRLSELKASLLHAQEKVSVIKKKLHAQEIESNALDIRRNAAQKNLDQTMQAKDFFAFTSELETIKKSAVLVEERLFALWEEHEVAEKEYTECKESETGLIPALEKETNIILNRIAELDFEQKKYEEARLHKAPQVIPELYEQYENLRKVTPYAAVPMQKESCSFCFYPINSADRDLLMRSQIVPCKDCYRLLYVRS